MMGRRPGYSLDSAFCGSSEPERIYPVKAGKWQISVTGAPRIGELSLKKLSLADAKSDTI